jgi:hypothetical protein
MLKRGHKHDWYITSVVAGSGCVIGCRCGALVRVLLVGGMVRPEVLRDGGHRFTVRDGQVIVELASAVIGPPVDMPGGLGSSS